MRFPTICFLTFSKKLGLSFLNFFWKVWFILTTLHIDLETFSYLDIKQVGLYKYAENCQILLCAFAFDDLPVVIIDLASGEEFPADFLDALLDPNILKTAYNAPFEFNVLAHHLSRSLDITQWTCTMVLGLYLGLPAGLDMLGNVLHLSSDMQKISEGKRLINFFSRPLKSKDDTQLSLFQSTETNRNLPQFHSEKWIAFKEYCKQDVIAERAIHNHLIKFAPPVSEHKLWCLDQKINSFGVLIELNFVKGALAIDSAIQNDARQQSQLLTGGLNLYSNFQLLNWIEQQIGWRPTSLDKNSRTLLREKNLSANIRQLLDLKDAVSKTSVKKYQAMLDTICADGRARGMFQFYGANRTGRWAGRLIQLQNLPQIHINFLDSARVFVQHDDIDSIKSFFGNPADVLSQLIRTSFIAPDGCRFIIADFSAIEARVIAWLANEKWRLDVFADGGDIYCASASEMFKVPVEKHGVNHELRAKGKIAELACGFGGGVNALKAFGADKMGLSDEDMDSIIKKWRASSPNICKLWRDVEAAAFSAIKSKSPIACHKGISFHAIDDFLFINLPSGRKLAYFKPRIIKKDDKEALAYFGNIQSSGGWGLISTWGGKLVENIVQAIARDCLAVALTRLDDAGYKIVMHIHDEIVCEMPNSKGSLEEVINIMCRPIVWADGLLLAADGYVSSFYRKD